MATRIKACRAYLVSSIQKPQKLMTTLSRYVTSHKDKIDEINLAPFCQQVEKLLSIVEQADSKFVDIFLLALRDTGYQEQADLITYTGMHNKAGTLCR